MNVYIRRCLTRQISLAFTTDQKLKTTAEFYYLFTINSNKKIKVSCAATKEFECSICATVSNRFQQNFSISPFNLIINQWND